MGRKTFESLPPKVRPLPGRTNIVVTRDLAWHYEGVVVCNSLEAALEKARALDPEEIFIGGGTQIYEQALPHVTRLYLTLIDDEKEGDAFFPPYEKEFTKVISDESRERGGLKYRWLTLERK
jgi:dihydrofolate reductase